jgi:hypothetical protein
LSPEGANKLVDKVNKSKKDGGCGREKFVVLAYNI